MNNSGESLLSLKQWYKIDFERIIVIYDDIDLDPGVVRIRAQAVLVLIMVCGPLSICCKVRAFPGLESESAGRRKIGS